MSSAELGKCSLYVLSSSILRSHSHLFSARETAVKGSLLKLGWDQFQGLPTYFLFNSWNLRIQTELAVPSFPESQNAKNQNGGEAIQVSKMKRI